MAQIRAKTKSFPEHAICPKEPAVVQGAAGALGGFQEQLGVDFRFYVFDF